MVTIMPNVQGLLSEFLRNHADVVALVDDRVYTALPAEVVWPAVRLTRIGGDPLWNSPYIIDQPVVQVEVWGGPKATALLIAETIRGAIVDDLPGQHDGGYVYGGDGVGFGSLLDMPDTTFDPAKPRFVFTVNLMTRPVYPPDES